MDKLDFDVMIKIMEKADEKGLLQKDRITFMMDLENAHKQFNLRLNDFLNSKGSDFSHDIVGIQNNINRKTMKIENCFSPRFSS